MSIVVVGSVAFDTIETPEGRVERAIGGSATYFSMAASYFVPVKLVAVAGEDFGDEHKSILRERGVDLDGLTIVEGGKTFFWEGRYGKDPNERLTVATELNVFEGFQPVLPQQYRDTDWIFLGNIDPVIQSQVLDQASGRPHVGCDTMNFWIERKSDELRDVLRRVDILFINDEEAKQLSGEFNLVQAGQALLEMGPEVIVIKKGEHGAFLITEEFRFVSPAYPLRDVVDPTGAGDSFAGGFMGYLAGTSRMDQPHLRRAMLYGTATASFTCERYSVERLQELTRDAIADRFDELVGITSVERDQNG
ncbi:MAG: sugar kinase [bacterium]|nr:MAG: sugar kinase [bacterium]